MASVSSSDMETLERRPSACTAENFQPHAYVEVADDTEQNYEAFKVAHAPILSVWDEFMAMAKGKRVAVFSDYDGTLTPIVDRPDEAFMSEDMRKALREVAECFPTAIISGRSREKVQNFVQINTLYYAGSHGLDIAGPPLAGESLVHQPAPWALDLMNSIHDKLVELVTPIEGASVEHNTYCVSVHYRLCVDRWQELETIVEGTVAPHDNLTVSRGRKVYEIRPRVDWNKGKALLFLLEALNLRDPGTFAVYLGDDNSDEDAFNALQQNGLGVGIIVASRGKATAAKYSVRGPSDVQQFFHRLLELRPAAAK